MFTNEKEYTIDSFKFSNINKNICADGDFKSSATWNGYFWDINYSSILSKLIVETGRLVEHYASDLFISWKSIEKNLANPDYKGGKYLFGLRENGVDHNSFVIARFNNYGVYASQFGGIYRKLYMLEIKINENGDISMELGEAKIR